MWYFFDGTKKYLIIYDNNIIKYNELLKIYFENIDPFDGEGQFIDRGSSYQTAVFTNDLVEINCFKSLVNYIENKYKKYFKISVDIFLLLW